MSRSTDDLEDFTRHDGYVRQLPDSLVRTISSSQTIIDVAILVKELIDNALDAGASSIRIEISPNILDVIQVRDNGTGIPLEDRLLVAKRHCTSKIRGLDDLKSIGGTNLGFRGEALASIATMSGSMAIITRTERDQIAAKLEVGENGKVTR